MDEKLEELLRSYLAQTGASALRITRNPGNLNEHQLHAKLAAGVYLVASFVAEERCDSIPSRRELLERAARAFRAHVRESAAATNTRWPEVVYPDAETAAHNPQRLILARIQQFLRGLVDSSPFHQQVVILRGRLIASALPLEHVEEVQLDLLSRQLENAGKAAIGTAHGELVRPGLYARGFWYGAALIGFCNSDYSVDFVRHSSKMVTHELTTLLAMLDGDPDKPVKQAPPP
ncbi:MAG: hypothetical protein GY811_09165 [Myxococcales bacterium]|nr:hypothetical protein [Myxococcales bacterium]